MFLLKRFFCKDYWENCNKAQDNRRKRQIINANKLAKKQDLGIFSSRKQKEKADKSGQKKEKENNKEEEDNKKEEGNKKEDNKEEEDNKKLKKENKQIRKNQQKQKPISKNNNQSPPWHVIAGGGSSTHNQQKEEQDKTLEDNQEDSQSKQEKILDLSITYFDIFDLISSSTAYTASTTVGVNLDIEDDSQLSSLSLKYQLSLSEPIFSSTSSQWATTAPKEFSFNNEENKEKTVYIKIMANKTATATASSSIFIDTKAPTSTIDNLKDNYDSYDFILKWQGEDMGTTTSGINGYDIDFKIGTTTTSTWTDLIRSVTSTSTQFSYSTTTDNTIFFRARAKDKAGNESEWSKIASTTVNLNTKADHIVISEIYSTNDWIELYNPTDTDVDLASSSYRIERSTGSSYYFMEFGNTEHGRFFGGTVIPAQSHYLIVDKDNLQSLKNKADAMIGANRDFALNKNDIVSLASGHVSSSTDDDIIDLVGYGQSSFYEGEGTAPNPVATSSIERKALATSTASKLATSSHKLLGNSYDTDNNNWDFVLQEKPNPQNSGNNLAWPERNHDSQNTNRSQYVGQISGDATSSIFFATSTYKIGRILIGDDYMYAMMINSNKKNKLYSIELNSGEKEQIYAYGQAGLAAIDKNNIYLKTREKIISIDKESSEPNWKFNAWFPLRDIHLSSQGDIFTATKGTCDTDKKYKIYKINSENGTTTWEKTGKGTVREYYGTVLDEQNNFYVPISMGGLSLNGEILGGDFLALNRQGELLWSYNESGNNPTMGANGLVAGNDKIYYTRNWNSTDYLCSTSGDSPNVSKNEEFEKIHHTQTSRFVPRGVTTEGRLVIYGKKYGKDNWQLFVGKDIQEMQSIVSPGMVGKATDMVIDADNNVYLMGNGKLVAIDMDEAEIKWQIKVNRSSQNLVMGPAGKLYFGVDNKGIYVVD